MIEAAVNEGIILGMGNPLLDISAVVDAELLEKYDLDENNAILAEEKHAPLYEELVESYKPSYIAGGATQNAIRVAQWMLQSTGATSYFGAVGADDYAAKMVTAINQDGVNVQYQTSTDTPTGTCAVLITGKHRSLVANLAAANTYKIDHLNEDAQWSVVEKASLYYIAGFFLTVSPDSMIKVAKHANEAGKTFCFNLSAAFLMQVPPFFNSMKQLLPFVDVLFGSEIEAVCLCNAMGWSDIEATDMIEIARRTALLPREGANTRTVVFTQGHLPTVAVVARDGKIIFDAEFPIIPIAEDEIVDTNAAGDGFVGGYLAGLAKSDDMKECIAKGHYAAKIIIQHSGCTFPSKPDYEKA